MTTRFIADASIAIAWIAGSQATELTRKTLVDAIAGAEVHVPPLWFYEVANGLLLATRRKLITEAAVHAGLSSISAFRIVKDEGGAEPVFTSTFELAQRYGLTIYDAAYLELALRTGIPLATRDSALGSAAKRCGVKLVK